LLLTATAPGDRYDLANETGAVKAAARTHGLSRHHLPGFPAGATVALGQRWRSAVPY
jgi:hypothetical protein